jgi:hypothetical protein
MGDHKSESQGRNKGRIVLTVVAWLKRQRPCLIVSKHQLSLFPLPHTCQHLLFRTLHANTSSFENVESIAVKVSHLFRLRH